MTAVEEQRASHHAHCARLLPEMLARLNWSRPQIDAFRIRAFRNMLAHAKAHSPWHASRLADLDPAAAEIGDLRRLPVMTKSDLMENWDRIVTVPGATRAGAEAAFRAMKEQTYVWNDHVLLASGGTGGQPGLFLYDWDAIATNWAGMSRGMSRSLARLALRSSGNDKFRTVAIGAENSAHGSYVMARIFSNPQNPTELLSAWRTGEELFDRLNDIQPHVMSVYPTRVPMLAAAAEAGKLRIRPHLFFFVSEHLSDSMRKLVKRTWPKADLLCCWATSEGAGTFPCPLSDGFHISEDMVVLEPVNAQGDPVKRGERSAGIYLTNLFNKALPILRYYIDDVFEMDDRPCVCGSAYRKVAQVHGRSFEFFRYGERAVHPLALELAVLEQPAIEEYQIRQTVNGAHLLYSSKGGVNVERLHSKITSALIGYGLEAPDVRIEQVDVLARSGASKLVRFVSLSR